MPFPSPVLQANANIWDANLYKEAFDMRFQDDFTSRLAINLITEFIPGNYSTKITRPTFEMTGEVVKDEVSCVRGGIASTEVGIEELVRKDRYYKSYQYCPDNVKRTDVGVEEFVRKADMKIKEAVLECMSKNAVDIAIANAGTTIAAVTDAASALAALDAVTAQFSGYSESLSTTAIIPSTLLPFFRELGATRITNLGDMFFQSGKLYDIFGVALRVVDAAKLTNPNAVLFVIGKPVKFYYETMGMGINEYQAHPDVAAGQYVNTNLVREVLVEGDFHVWSGDEKAIVVAA